MFNFYIALVIVFAVGFLSYRMKLLDLAGSLGGILIGVLMIIFADYRWFLLLLIFFILGGVFTRYRYEYKQSLGIVQEMRDYRNVLGNGFAALCMAVSYGLFDGNNIFLFGFLGAIATATADTLATEIGETGSPHPRLITNLKPTKPGTNGAISILGELSAILGSAVIALSAVIMGIGTDFTLGFLILVTVSGGFFGTNIDSLLGATLEERGILTNNTVNLSGTFLGALVSIGVYLWFI